MTTKDIVRLAECKKWLLAKILYIMKYNKVDFGITEAVFNKLGGIKGIEDFLTGKTQIIQVEKSFKSLGSISVGSFNTDSLSKEIKNNRSVRKSEDAMEVLNWPPLLPDKEELELFMVKPYELGFDQMFESCATYKNICTMATRLGFVLCSQDTGMLLCLSNNKLEEGLYIVASEPLKTKTGVDYLLVPTFEKKEIGLRALKVKGEKNKDNTFYLGMNFVFARRKIEIK